METYEAQQENYFITTDKSKLDVNVIHKYLSEESYWALNISLDIIEKAIDNSLCFGLFYKDENNKIQQVGFARLVTDKATFAYLADVFVLNEHRGKGLSKFLMQAIHTHDELQILRRWMLVTKDAQGLYQQFGWTNIPEEQIDRYMIKYDADIYRRSQ